MLWEYLFDRYTGGATLTLKDVDVGIADNTLIKNLNWNILPNERWCIVGTNGPDSAALRCSWLSSSPPYSTPLGDLMSWCVPGQAAASQPSSKPSRGHRLNSSWRGPCG